MPAGALEVEPWSRENFADVGKKVLLKRCLACYLAVSAAMVGVSSEGGAGYDRGSASGCGWFSCPD